MTITTNDARNEYTATAGQTVFNYTFKIFANNELDVYVTPVGQDPDDISDLTTAYTVDLGTIGDESGGFITMDSPLSAGDRVTIVSGIPYDRTVDYQQNGDFLPETVNRDNDRQVAQIKQVLEAVKKAVVFGQATQGTSGLASQEPQAGRYIRWKNDLSGFENVDLSQSPDNLTTSDLAVTFNSVAEMKLSTLSFLVSGQIVETKWHTTQAAGGGARYLIQTPAEYGGTPDEYGDHTLSNGNIAVLQSIGVYVDQYGAVGDGSTDDSASIQAADAAAATKGVPVVFPGNSSKIYPIDPYSPTASWISSSTLEKPTIKSRSSNVYTLSIDTAATKLRGLVIDNNNQGTSFNIRVNADGCEVKDCHLKDTGGNAASGSVIAVELRDNADNFRLIDNLVEGVFDGIRINRGASHTTIEGNEFTGWGGRAVYGLGSSVATSRYIYIRKNYFHDPVAGTIKYPIQINGSTYEFQNVYVIDNKLIGPDLAYDGINPSVNNATADQIALQGVRWFIVAHNQSHYGGDVGITVSQGSSDGIVCNNDILEADTVGIFVGAGGGGTRVDRVQVFGNNIKNSGQNRDAAHSAPDLAGVRFNDTDGCFVSGNHITDSASPTTEYGISITDSTTLSRGQNTIKNVGTGKYYYSGTNSFQEGDSFTALNATPLISQLTIAAGVITVTGSYHRVLTEASAATDDLDTINGGVDGMRLTLRTTSSSFDVVVKNGTGNITLAKTGADITLDVNTKPLELIYDSLLGKWLEL